MKRGGPGFDSRRLHWEIEKEIRMSATSEVIAEQIRQLKNKIQEAKAAGQDTTVLEEQHVELSKKFSTVTQALNEGKSLLKG